MTRRKIVITILILLLPVLAYFAFYVYADARLENKVNELEARGIHCRPADFAARHHPSPQPVLDEFNKLVGEIKKAPLPAAGKLGNKEAFLPFFSENKELLTQADAFLDRHPDLTFARDFSRGIHEMQWPELVRCLDWMRVNHQRTEWELELGNPEAAALLFDRSAALRNYTLKEAFFLSFIVGITVEQIRQFSLFEAAANGRIDRFDTARLRRWMEAMVPLEKEVQTAYPPVIDSELAYKVELANNPVIVLEVMELPSPLRPLSWLAKPFFRLDVAKNMDLMLRLREAGSRDYFDTGNSEAFQKELYALPSWQFITRMQTPPIDSYHRRACREYSRYRTLRTGLAVELYLRKHGKLPETLEELIPEFLPDIPVSPFTREPLRYEKGKLERLGDQSEIVEFEGYRIHSDRDPDPPSGETRHDQYKRLPIWNRALPIKEP